MIVFSSFVWLKERKMHGQFNKEIWKAIVVVQYIKSNLWEQQNDEYGGGKREKLFWTDNNNSPGIKLLVGALAHPEADPDLLSIPRHGRVIEVERHYDGLISHL